MTISLYNTLTRQKDALVPEDEKHVRMYVCGPTVYDRAHLGNARSVVVYDVLYRLLRHVHGAEHVTYVRNITDVDDKINKAAVERGITIQKLTEEVTGWFHADMEALNCLRPNAEPKATEHIPHMIEMIEALIKNGHAYVAEGHVLFDVMVPLSPNRGERAYYGMLSGRSLDDLIAGARIEVAPYKKNPGDFVLWKPAAATDDASSKFESPWGVGRPGWHIECSAMATELLGDTFDIHGGGADLMFPHHENEIAQACAANPGSHFAKMWVHNGFLTVHGEKMSKSLGNFITVRDLLEKGVHGEVIRFALLSTHYRKPLDWTESLLNDSKISLGAITDDIFDTPQNYDEKTEKLFRDWLNGQGDFPLNEAASNLVGQFVEALNNDMNVSVAIALMHNIRGTARHVQEKPNVTSYQYKAALKTMCDIIGFGVAEYKKYKDELALQKYQEARKTAESLNVDALIEARKAAKAAKNWAEADRIREELKAEGILLEDKPGGATEWRRI